MSEKEALLPMKHILCFQRSLWRCTDVQYHQSICAKSHLIQFSRFQTIGKARKQGETIWIKWYFVRIFI